MQSAGIGALKPNTVIVGWMDDDAKPTDSYAGPGSDMPSTVSMEGLPNEVRPDVAETLRPFLKADMVENCRLVRRRYSELLCVCLGMVSACACSLRCCGGWLF